jgi:tRNA modification GTPase
MTGDTIAAIATAMSASGIGIIRISGDDSMEIISKVYRSKGGKKQIKEAESHTIHYGFIYDNDTMIDEVLVMIMKGPRSYTGEDTVEIDCHGGVLAMKKVLEAVIHAGCKTGGTGRIYQACLLKRKDRPVSGGGGHRCDPGEE